MFFLAQLTPSDPDVMIRLVGAVAQLGARLTGSQEVAGSIPASSTNPSRHFSWPALVGLHFNGRSAAGMTRKPFTTATIFLLGLITLLHLVRLLLGWEVTLNGVVIPMWVSAIGIIVAAVFAVMIKRESS